MPPSQQVNPDIDKLPELWYDAPDDPYPIGVCSESIAEVSRLVKSVVEQCRLESWNMNDRRQMTQVVKEIEELKARLPKHSVPAAMIIELEELEEEMERLKAQDVRDNQ